MNSRMPHMFWNRKQSTPANTSQPAMGNQSGNPHAPAPQPNNIQHPFPTDDRNGELYKLPGYRYPHTLSFLGFFSPEVEGQIIEQFQHANGQLGTVPLPLAGSFNASFRSEGEVVEQTGGWGQFGNDLDEMGLGPIVDAIGLSRTPKANRQISFVQDGSFQSVSSIPTVRLNPGAAADDHPPAAQNQAHQPQAQSHQTDFGILMDIDGPSYAHDDNVGPQVDPLWHPDAGEETEEDSDWDEVGEHWRRKMASGTSSNRNPIACSAFGPGFTVGRTRDGKLCGVPNPNYIPSNVPRSNHPATTWMAPEDLASSHGAQHLPGNNGGVKYPSLPSFTSSRASTGTVVHNPQPEAPAQPTTNSALTGTTTPAGYLPSYRPRRPTDTVFHHGSAGVNPLGAHARGVQKASATNGGLAASRALRQHRIVSGSFGSFETRPPSRFDERRYRLFQEHQKEDGN